MRLITRTKLYRAFPELDSYDDAQCELFIKAALGSLPRRLARWVFCSLAPYFVFVLLAVLIRTTWQAFSRIGPRAETTGMVVGLVVFASLPLFAMVLRDRLLARRVRRVLRVTGSCSACGYSLIGMPLDDQHRVICPECGAIKEVDPSLAILTRDDTGRMRIESITQAPELLAYWTPLRKRRAKRLALAAVLLFIVFPAALFGLYEAFLHWQAGQARDGRVPHETLLAIVEQAQPAGAGAGTPDAWSPFDRADALADRIDGQIGAAVEFHDQQGSPVRPDFSYIYATRSPDAGDSPEDADIARRAALRTLHDYEKAGVFQELQEMAACTRAVRPIVIDQTSNATSFGQGALIDRLLPWLGRTRHFARVNAARMHLAAEAGDRRTYMEALDQALALAQMNARQGSAIEQLIAIAIYELVTKEVREYVPTCTDDAWLADIERTIAARPLGADVVRMLQVERLAGKDAIAAMFSDPGNVRFGRFNPKQRRGADVRVGTYAGAIRELDDYYDDLEAIVKGQGPPQPRMPTGIASVWMAWLNRAFDLMNASAASHDGTRLLAAIRRYELAHGRLPELLDQLVPAYIDRVPTDPRGSGPFKFVRIDPSKDRLARPYLVYSVGLDGLDDGGVEFNGVVKTSRETPGTSHGTDRVFNSDW